ncbi:hypothetical protein KY284_000843 [Solanum tuberosum]|nr:hypothetical protein KY284_000843 [Solanum tuberosum]
MMCAPLHTPHLVCHLVDVTRTKAHDPSQGLVLTIVDRKTHDDSWIGHIFGMAKLQLRLDGRLEDYSKEDESNDNGPGDDDTDAGDRDGGAALMAMDFATNDLKHVA